MKTARFLVIYLVLALLPGAWGGLAEAGEAVFAAPVDEAVSDAEAAELWTEDIAEAVNAAQAAEERTANAENGDIPIDGAHFPDEAFRGYVKDNFDADGDGALSESERTGVTVINVDEKNISTLQGVKYFPSLAELVCRNNPLADLDVSGLTALKELQCDKNQLANLNVGGCTALEELCCSSNRLSTLDLSGLVALTWLQCSKNNIASVSLKGCEKLKQACFDHNLLTRLNISECPCLIDVFENGYDAVYSEYGYVSYFFLDILKMYNLMVDLNVEIFTTPDEPVEEPVLAAAKATIGVKQTYSLLAADSPVPAAACRFKSGDKKIAKVNKKGVVTGVKAGKTTVTVTTPSGAKLKCKITVKKAPKTIALKPKRVELDVGRTASLLAKTTSGSVTAITWKSDNEAVATVESSGAKTAVVSAVGGGTATVTATTSNGLSAVCAVQVIAEPTGIKITAKTRKVQVGKKLTLKAKLTPAGAQSTLKWESDNPSVAKVSQKGVVTGLAKGKANITVATGNGLQATVKITVKENPVTYRALLVGQVNYDPSFAAPLPACAQDARLMKNMLNHVKGASGGKFKITEKTDLSYDAFKAAVRLAFADADDNDVSLLYYSGHGVSAREDDYAGALCMVPKGYYKIPDLADLLQSVPGKVIVIFDSCGSGASIYQEEGAENAQIAASFDAAVIDAFAAADPGAFDEGFAANTGELRVTNKYYVLVAARHRESSMASDYASYFTGWLTDGVGLVGDMPADADRNRYVTLNELFKYIKKVGNDFPIYDDDGNVHYQHVQVYPKKSGFRLFYR